MSTTSGASLQRRPQPGVATSTPPTSPSSPLAGYPAGRFPRVGRMLDTAVRDALRQLRAACVRTPDEHAAQAFTDAVKGRHIGTLSIQRMLLGARMAGAQRDDALQLVRAIEGIVLTLWRETHTHCPRTALEAETLAQAQADAVQVRAVLSECAGDLDAAIERTQRAISAQHELLITLVARRTLQGA